MESWEVLRKAIPRSESKRVASILGITADYVRRWRREPESDDAPTGSGQQSILDRICLLIDAVFLVNPGATGLIVNYIVAHHRSLLQLHAKPIVGSDDKAATISELLTQTTEAINSFNLHGCTPDTIRELIEARDAFGKAIECVESTINETEDETNA